MKILPQHTPLLAALLASMCFVTLVIGAGCLKVPYTGRKHIVLLPFGAEVALGEEAYAEILEGEEIVSEGAVAASVLEVGSSISRLTPQPFRDLNWEFKLIGSSKVNAFALPGGKVAVYNGMVPVLATEAGLAAVVGHEVGHAIARHGGERISGTMLLQLGLAVADISLASSEHHDQILGLLGLGAEVGIILPFSRANELEADYLGGLLMARAGFDPRESVGVWERMTELHGSGGPEFLSTHPSNATRIERLKEEMPTFLKHYNRVSKKLGRGNDLVSSP